MSTREYNNFWDHRDITYESGTVTEPVTLDEVKDYLRLQGFTDDDESPSESLSDFDFDDDLLTDMIKAARETFEEYCGLSLIPKTIQAMISNPLGGQEIGYGPVGEVTELLHSDGTELTGFTVSGVQWKRLLSPFYCNMKITYEAGYTTLPKPIKVDLLRCIAYIYTNRGDAGGIEKFVSQLAKKYSRNVWLA